MSPMADKPVVHIVDDDEAVRESLAFLLQAENLEVRTFDSATSFLAGASPSITGCLITDVRMPGLSGIELMRRLRALSITLPVIVITGHGDVPLAVEAMRAGALDLIEKPFDDSLILKAVKSALEVARAKSERDAERTAVVERLATLTSRERDVLKGIIAGNANKVIAYDLGISPRTVEVYRANVMTKMKADSLSELVRMCLTAGL
jgi:two-component system response regulator FixJ